MSDQRNLLIIMWICLIVANVQMWFVEGTFKYFGFIPLLWCWIILTIDDIRRVQELRKNE